MKKLRIYKEVEIETTVDVETEVEVSNSEIVEALRYSEDLDDLLEEAGFIKLDDFGNFTVLDTIKLDIIKDLLQKATLDQLEQFQKSL